MIKFIIYIYTHTECSIIISGFLYILVEKSGNYGETSSICKYIVHCVDMKKLRTYITETAN